MTERAPFTARVLFPVSATLLMGGWLAVNGAVIVGVLTLDPEDVPPRAVKAPRLSAEPESVSIGDRIRIRLDFSGMPDSIQEHRLAVAVTTVEREDPIRQPFYVVVERRRGWVEFEVPANTAQLRFIDPQQWCETLLVDVEP